MIALTLAGLLLSGVVLGGCMVGTCWLQARADAGRRQYVRGYDAGFVDGGRAARRRVADDYQRGWRDASRAYQSTAPVLGLNRRITARQAGLN